ncbi:glycine-rich protein, partial [Odoribacter sp. Z80]|uniref:glycine-rich protein n=1 Tax=Odoribacter sp. Z80 TaxID=2304575 RepID=UPI001F28604B
DVRLEVLVVPYTRNPFPDKVVTYAYNGQNSYQIANTWSGPDAQRWTLTNGSLGTLEISDRGLVSNVSSTMCSHITVEAVCEDFPDKVYRMELHEPSRSYASAGAYTLNLLPGEYTFECWGARGSQAHANGSNSGTPGNGGYAYGEYRLGQQKPFYLYVGGAAGGASGHNGGAGGWNGGATGGYDSDDDPGGGGGGASDIRVVGGAWNDAVSLRNRIMVAGGGGGCGWSSPGGNGGGLQGVRANSSANATQTSGAAFGWASVGGNGGNGHTGAGGGGGGYYGGYGAPGSSGGGGGGSGFVSGMEGCNAVNESGAHTGQPNHFSGIIFQNPKMTQGGAAGKVAGAVKITVK